MTEPKNPRTTDTELIIELYGARIRSETSSCSLPINVIKASEHRYRATPNAAGCIRFVSRESRQKSHELPRPVRLS